MIKAHFHSKCCSVYARSGFPKLCAVKGIKVCRKIFVFSQKAIQSWSTDDLSQGGPILHSCGPLFKIIRLCEPQPAKNTYFCHKLRVFSKKKKRGSSIGIDLSNSYFLPKIIAFSKKKKVAAACNRQDLCKIVPQARSWTTLIYSKMKLYAGIFKEGPRQLLHSPHPISTTASIKTIL